MGRNRVRVPGFSAQFMTLSLSFQGVSGFQGDNFRAFALTHRSFHLVDCGSQVIRSHVRISQSHLRGFMPKQLLNPEKVNANGYEI
jgi:hypothetical protein